MVQERSILMSWNKSVLWPGIIEHTARAVRLSAEEIKRLSKSLAAEIIAATAFISGCKDPDRIAIAHLTTFISAIRCPDVFGHRAGESLTDRLLAGNYFPGGSPEAVKAGMLLLELISLNDHRHDFQADLISGKNNPLINSLNYDAEKERIEKEFYKLPSVIKTTYKDFYRSSIKNFLW